jgi:hypothetical protein
MQLGCSFACSWKSPEISVYLRKHRHLFIDFSWFVPNFALHINWYRLRSLLAIYLFRRLVYFIKEYIATPWRVAVKYCHFSGRHVTGPDQGFLVARIVQSSSHWSPGNEVGPRTDIALGTRLGWRQTHAYRCTLTCRIHFWHLQSHTIENTKQVKRQKSITFLFIYVSTIFQSSSG